MRYFEDYAVGERYETDGRTITESDISRYVELCGLFEPIFVDVEHVREETQYDERFAPGELTISFALGNVIRSPFVDNALSMLQLDTSFVEPVFAGDTIYVQIEVVEVNETSDPSKGIVVFDYDVLNQDGTTVLEMQETALIKARAEDATA